MPHRIRLTDDGDADWAALRPPVRRIVRARLREVATNPFGRWVLRLCGHPDRLRVRADGHRVLYTVEITARGPNIVNVFRIRPRETAYVGYEFDQH